MGGRFAGEAVVPESGGVPMRRRLSKQKGGRTQRAEARLTEEEYFEVRRRPAELGVSVARLMVESTLMGDRQTVSERRALVTAFLAARRQVAVAATNLNQLAKVANSTGRVPEEVAEAAERMERLGSVLDDAAERLSVSVASRR